jgi:hypothetical protein
MTNDSQILNEIPSLMIRRNRPGLQMTTTECLKKHKVMNSQKPTEVIYSCLHVATFSIDTKVKSKCMTQKVPNVHSPIVADQNCFPLIRTQVTTVMYII